ncbi:glycerate kinase, partial [Halomonas sp. SIMBA_159]
QFNVACDVTNPLHGETGAAYIFGPQKGATPEMVEKLDQGLRNVARIASEDLGKDIQNPPGAGAAGGLGAAFIGFLEGELKSGIELILESVKMEEQIKDVDIVVTGEGKLDGQTSMGKTASGVAQLAKKMG